MRGESVQGGATRESGVPGKVSGRIPELDGLRGIAIGMVLLFHYFDLAFQARPGSFFAHVLTSGRLLRTGVDLFFVLSGFLIGGILLDARGSTNYFQVFYTRRFFRIVPIYAVCLGIVFALGFAVHHGLAPRFAWIFQEELPWIPHVLFLQNFWMAFRNSFGQLAITWSLAVEEQFYLTLPLLIRILSPRRLLYVLAAGILAAPLLRIAMHALWPDRYIPWFVLMPTRADALLLGVAGAVALRNERFLSWLASRRGLVLGLLFPAQLVGVTFFALRSVSTFPLTSLAYTGLALFYLSILLYALTWRESSLSAFLRWRPLGWLGSIAYGTYLFHVLVLLSLVSIMRGSRSGITSLADFVARMFALVLTISLCQLSWTYFEKPLVALGHRTCYVFTRPERQAASAALAEGD
jgi:peptidoglycan/LPS O-acetylase OafA/YrhL